MFLEYQRSEASDGEKALEEQAQAIGKIKTATRCRSCDNSFYHVMTLSTIACCSLAVRRR